MTSAAEANQLAADTGREVAFAGRSNSGKSTAINAITQRSGLARVSRTPGRTQLINFFELAPEQRLVDLPGYGYAKVPESVRLHWLELMEHYFNVRESLVGFDVDRRQPAGLERAGCGDARVGFVERSFRACSFDESRQTEPARFTARAQGNAGCRGRMRRCRRNCFRPMNAAGSKKRARSWSAGSIFIIKKPRWTLVATTGADQPGMGMTNRVMPAQGEERGAS